MSDPTYLRSEAHRHDCEVRWVCTLSKPERDRYFYGDRADPRSKTLAQIRGEAAAQRLIADARSHYPHRHTKTPNPQVEGQPIAAAAYGRRPGGVVLQPEEGSFPAVFYAGPLRRDGTVVSGESA